MTLLIAVFAAIVSTIVWYVGAPKSRKLYVGVLALMYWGASIMWLADAIMEYRELGAKYFEPAAKDMLNDSFLGLSVVALGLIIWLIILLIKDPKGVLRKIVKEETED